MECQLLREGQTLGGRKSACARALTPLLILSALTQLTERLVPNFKQRPLARFLIKCAAPKFLLMLRCSGGIIQVSSDPI
jgi:hypothetical protein